MISPIERTKVLYDTPGTVQAERIRSASATEITSAPKTFPTASYQSKR